MQNAELKKVHIGAEIKKRMEELNMTKTEFGSQIGVQQQHINKLLERDYIDTKKLYRICEVLDFNFFALYCSFPTSVNAYLAAVTLGDGAVTNNIGEAAVLAHIEKMKAENEGLHRSEQLLADQVEQLKSQLADKDEIIRLYKEK